MAGREKLAWILLAMAAAALAAAAFAPTHAPASAGLQPAASPGRDDIKDQLMRIQNRLDHLDSLRQAGSSGASSIAASSTSARAITTTDAGTPPSGLPDAGDSIPALDAQTSAVREQSRLAASTLVDRAIQAGTWTRKDADAWVTASAGMRAEDRYALVRRLVVEVNSDRLKLDPGATFR
jgi:hypothetical protein